MSNILQFKPKQQPAPVAPEQAEDRLYWLSDIETAMKVATFVYNDTVACNLLLGLYKDMHEHGTHAQALSLGMLTICAKYLSPTDEDYKAYLCMAYSTEWGLAK